MLDDTFELVVDFDRLRDICLESAATLMYTTDKEQKLEREIILESLDVWSACILNSGESLAWERKPAHIDERTTIKNFS